ncbi:MAG TPA: META domain-containing protein [Solirubrobacterales bacterium]|nr:META domain-containing protein [Solirubrobacterales bacterium]
MPARLPKPAIRIGLAVIACVAVAGCGGDDGNDQAPAAADLRGRTFVSTKDWSGEGSAFSSPVTLQFTADGHIGWQADCNSFGAEVEITADRLLVGEIAGTLVGCPEPELEQDEDLSGFFESDPNWRLDGDRLTLSTDSVEVALQAAGSRPDPDLLTVPKVAPPKLEVLLARRDGEASVKCSASDKTRERVLRGHPTLDLVAPPSRVCTVKFSDGTIVDFLLIRDHWLQARRTFVVAQ